jgi:MFS family permease
LAPRRHVTRSIVKGHPHLITDYLTTVRRFGRDIRLYLITSAILGFTQFGGIYPVLLNLYLLRLGLGPQAIGLVNAAGMLAFGGFSLPAGVLGGRWGIRRTMIAGMWLAVPAYMLLPVGTFGPLAVRTGWAVAMNALGSAGMALYIVNSTPFVMGIAGPRERVHAFSVQGALWPLAGFAGSLVGGLLPGLFAAALGLPLDDQAPFRYPLLVAAFATAPIIPVMLATRDVRPAEEGETPAGSGPAPYGLLVLVVVVVLLRSVGSGVARTFFNIYLDTELNVRTAQIGALTAAGQLLSGPAVLAVPLMMRRWGAGRTYVLASSGIAIGLLPMAFVRHWGAAGMGNATVVALALVTSPAITVYHQERVSPGWRATASGATSMAVGLSWSATALGGGYLIAWLGYQQLFLIGAILTAAGALIFWAYDRKPRAELAGDLAPG